MCGIVGYVGRRQAYPILIEGLKRLEYRGYDSAGVALIDQGALHVVRAQGKIRALENEVDDSPPRGTLGIGHTRWATHGRPSQANAHPHRAGAVTVAHNGIIENYAQIKHDLTSKGRVFSSDTDTEVICQLADFYISEGSRPLQALLKTCAELKGAFALGLLIESEPDTLFAVRKESPLVVGVGDGEFYIASDIPAILGHTRRMIFMDDGEIAVLRPDGAKFFDFFGAEIRKTERLVDLNPVMAEKEGYKHFMLKEIHEQPRSVTDTFRGRVFEEEGRVFLDGLKLTEEETARLSRIVIVACGTSYHAGLVGKRMIESLARVPVEVDYAGEFRYRDPVLDERVLVIAVSQSGETADTIAAAKEAKARGAMTLGVCNVIESSLARICAQGVLYTHAGPEIGVASTKAFTTQLTAFYLFALHLGSMRRTIDSDAMTRLITDLIRLPALMEETLKTSHDIKSMARRYEGYDHFLYLGRGVSSPIASEGALKLKEISYIHAEAYPGGEMKHGPIALITEEMPVVAVLSRDSVYEKMVGNMQEVGSRGGILLVFSAGPHDPHVAAQAQEMVRTPSSNEYLTSILLTIPLQLFAYHIADFKGLDVDQPRNLAKSVTVE
jgi:glucosamine--fructose-6-phosphate aminotransferase (isomerizing)